MHIRNSGPYQSGYFQAVWERSSPLRLVDLDRRFLMFNGVVPSLERTSMSCIYRSLWWKFKCCNSLNNLPPDLPLVPLHPGPHTYEFPMLGYLAVPRVTARVSSGVGRMLRLSCSCMQLSLTVSIWNYAGSFNMDSSFWSCPFPVIWISQAHFSFNWWEGSINRCGKAFWNLKAVVKKECFQWSILFQLISW